jgi:hypothetical protein
MFFEVEFLSKGDREAIWSHSIMIDFLIKENLFTPDSNRGYAECNKNLGYSNGRLFLFNINQHQGFMFNTTVNYIEETETSTQNRAAGELSAVISATSTRATGI